MSLAYKIVENCCFAVNKLTNGGIKKQMHSFIAKKEQNDSLPWFLKKCFLVKEVQYMGFPVYIMRTKNKQKRTKKAVLFLAGGGGMARPMGLHFDVEARLAHNTGATVYFAYYPLAPKYNVTYALTWLEKVYAAMCKRFWSEQIIFVGDSAGANLALSLTDRVENKPGQLIVISPAVGLENGHDRDVRLKMEKKDPILTVEMNDMIAQNWSKNVPLNNPDINPEYINYGNFPPMLMFYGSHELFYPHVKRYVEKIKKSGGNVEIVEEPMCHDWALCSFLPEGYGAIKKMEHVIKNIE